MNQPIQDENEKLRMAQAMMADYVAGRLPPPPNFDPPSLLSAAASQKPINRLDNKMNP